MVHEIRGKEVAVEFVLKIREEAKFGSVEQLKNQIFADIENVKSLVYL